MRYRIQEGSLNLAGEWHDNSVNVLRLACTAATNIVVVRDASLPDQGLDGYIDLQRGKFRQLTDFTALQDVATTVDGRRAHFLEFTWTGQGKPIHQMAVVVEDRGKILNFTATMSGDVAADTRRFLLETIHAFQFASAGEA
jgi:hypothetical protein